jgi:putative solute:sodium symporter small subunit
MKPAAPPLPALSYQAAEYWRYKRRLTVQLLAIWLFSTFSVIYFARELNNLTLFGWPLSYYMAAQGLALVYLALIFIYNRRIGKMEEAMQAAELQSKKEKEKEKEKDQSHAE